MIVVVEPVAEDPEEVHERRPRPLGRPQADRGGKRPRPQILSERRDVIQAIDDSTTVDQAAGRVRSYCQSLDNDLTFTIDAMKTTIDQLAGVDGRKILIHVSDGLPQSPGAELWKYVSDKFRDASTHSTSTVRVRPHHEVPERRSGGECVGRVHLHDRRVRPLGRLEHLRREPHDEPAHRHFPRAKQPPVDAQPHGRGDRRRGHPEQERRPRLRSRTSRRTTRRTTRSATGACARASTARTRSR